jgi:hypothetical protein
MSILTEIQRMQKEGLTEQEIISNLKTQGISPREMTDALNQSKIKEAVAGTPVYAPPSPQSAEQYPSQQEAQAPQQAPAMAYQEQYTPSPQSAEQYPSQQEAQAPQQAPAMAYQEQYPAQQEAYSGYQQQYAPAAELSADTLTEISEQVVAEKLSPIRKSLEKVIELKTTIESKIESLDERLKRIEKIIDRLQISILQKVGEYGTNIEDIKKELIETQKSFKAITSLEAPKEKKVKSQPNSE